MALGFVFDVMRGSVEVSSVALLAVKREAIHHGFRRGSLAATKSFDSFACIPCAIANVLLDFNS
jgi:hypothetical protein